MQWDLQNNCSNNQAVTTTAASTNVIKLTNGNIKDVAASEIPFRIQVTEDFTGATSVDFWIETASDAAFTTPVALYKSGAIAVASLKAGYTAGVRYIPAGTLGYLRTKYTVVGTATAGKVSAGVVAANEHSFHEIN